MTKIIPSERQVVIGPEAELGRRSLTADATNWLVDVPTEPFKCQAQIRYNSTAKPATATLLDGGRLSVEFDTPQKGVAPGQAVVCYGGEDQDQVLGGGWIE